MCAEEKESKIFIDEERASVLGLKWIIEKDVFSFVVKTPEIDVPITKRKIVGCVAQLYDPNGFISPVTILGKILIQDLWRISLNWDEKVPQEIEVKWNELWKNIKKLEQFRIERWLGTTSDVQVEVHGFADASQVAYGAVLYVRMNYGKEQIKTNLLVSKTRVAPIKTLTVPRLELSAARLLAQLLPSAIKEMEWASVRYLLWSDSQVVLHWIRKLPCSLKVYVANRVSEIQSNTEIRYWRYVNTKENPADLLTRGLAPEEIVNNQLWLYGPKWLKEQEEQWPQEAWEKDSIKEMQAELKVHTVIRMEEQVQIFVPSMGKEIPLVERANKLEKIINILSFIFRFVQKSRGQGARRTKRKSQRKSMMNLTPTAREKEQAIEFLIRQEQERELKRELTSMRKNNQVQDGSKLEPLKPIIDSKGLLRVGGRLEQAN